MFSRVADQPRSTKLALPHHQGMSDHTSPRQLQWWDQIDEPVSRPLTEGADPCTTAIDRLSLACSAHLSARGDDAIAGLLGRWCVDMRGARTSLSAAMAIRDALDRLDRQACEPQCWQHLTAAEISLDAHIRAMRSQDSPDRQPPDRISGLHA